jgi:hypothetical protein
VGLLEERLRLEARLQAVSDTQQRFEEQKDGLSNLANHYAVLLAKHSELPKSRFTESDENKLRLFTQLVREQASDYNLRTFPANEIEISSDNYRPQKEGFEIGFELSASDAIRLKWAYLLSLIELARAAPTNHLGLLIFDEPRQQETAKLSFQKLLERAAETKNAKQQVIFATSEDLSSLREFLTDVDCNLIAIDGHVVRRL